MDALFAILLLSAKIRRSRRLREEMLGGGNSGAGRRGNRRTKPDGSIEVAITNMDDLYTFIRTGTA